MRIVIFCHSLVSDWNHGNAHFLRGVCVDLVARGHDLVVYEPENAWSVVNLVAEHGEAPLAGFARAYPTLSSRRYALDTLDLDQALDGADLVLVHEWNDHTLVQRIGDHRKRRGDYLLLFHDTHHRSVTDVDSMSEYALESYDGVLAFGEVITRIYKQNGWSDRVWTWHEAADIRVFRPIDGEAREGDLVWVGNWGDDERTAELQEFLLDPVQDLRLKARVHGVRYPDEARQRLAEAGIEYAGWLPNYEAPRVFARFGVTVHIPRRPYVAALPGIPTIRVFEALACGIPLISAPWTDAEHLFSPGKDYLVAKNGAEMRAHLKAVLRDRELAESLARNGLATIRERHTCTHRVDQLLGICAELGMPQEARATL